MTVQTTSYYHVHKPRIELGSVNKKEFSQYSQRLSSLLSLFQYETALAVDSVTLIQKALKRLRDNDENVFANHGTSYDTNIPGEHNVSDVLIMFFLLGKNVEQFD